MSEITIVTSQAQAWHPKYVKVDTCIFQKVGTGCGSVYTIGPFCSPGHPQEGRLLVRLVLRGPRDGLRSRTYLTKKQAKELAYALLDKAEEIDE